MQRFALIAFSCACLTATGASAQIATLEQLKERAGAHSEVAIPAAKGGPASPQSAQGIMTWSYADATATMRHQTADLDSFEDAAGEWATIGRSGDADGFSRGFAWNKGAGEVPDAVKAEGADDSVAFFAQRLPPDDRAVQKGRFARGQLCEATANGKFKLCFDTQSEGSVAFAPVDGRASLIFSFNESSTSFVAGRERTRRRIQRTLVCRKMAVNRLLCGERDSHLSRHEYYVYWAFERK